jgi:hypothetical protein
MLKSILAAFGVALLAILAFDVAGYRLLDGQRYCQYAFAPVDDFEGAGSTIIDVADTGSGCTPGVPVVCRVNRILLNDIRRPC